MTQTKTLTVLMGVSGCGKSSAAEALRAATGWPVLEGDDFHSEANVAKMSGGTPLTDADRADWVAAISQAVARSAAPQIILAYLEGSRELIHARLQARENHFMDATLLDSQFAALTVPSEAIHVSIDQSLTDLVNDIRRALDNQH
jgi:gluconate kinase